MGTADIQDDTTLRVVCGLDLQMLSTEEGGRRTALLGGCAPEDASRYRPDWRLPGMGPRDLTAAPVFGFSRENLAPGETCLAVIMQLIPETREWQQVRPGMEITCYEGPRMVGRARVLWTETVEEITEAHTDRWRSWLQETR